MRPTVFLDRTTPPHIITLVIVSGLAALNMNMFLPSLPGIAATYGADYALVQLSVSGYLACTGALQLVIGPLSDRYGRRPVLLAALVVFVVATAICTLAPTIELFLLGRMLQAGVVSSFVLSRAIVRDVVDTDRAASMIGYITMGMSVVPMVGPAFGGFLDGLFGWQATFVTIFIFAVITTVLVWADLGETNTTRSSSMLSQFAAYPDLVRSRRFWGYSLTATFASGAFFSFLGGGPYVASTILGMSPTALGFYFFFIAFGYMIGNFLSGRYASRVGVNPMMIYGNVIATIGTLIILAFFLAGLQYPITFFGPIFLVGIGNGVTLPSANAGIVSVRPHLAGSASGLGGAMIIGGGAALAALVGALLSPETGAYPLIILMIASSLLGILSALYVDKVAREVATAKPADGAG